MTDKLRVLDLFSGIGGFSLGLERTGGFETVAFCEIDPFCRDVLAKHWPDVAQHDDVTRLDGGRFRGSVDVVCGGFPCQDLSAAGRQAGIDGARSGLWGQLARVIGEVQPRYAIVENVSALLSGDSGRWFGRVLGDLAEIGYDAEWHCIPASAVGAPHRRDRVWIIAYPGGDRVREQPRGRRGASGAGEIQPGNDGAQGDAANANNSGPSRPFAGGGGQGAEKRAASTVGGAGAVANANGQRQLQPQGLEQGLGRRFAYCGEPPMADTISAGLALAQGRAEVAECSGGRTASRAGWWSVEPPVGRVADGVPRRVDRLKSLGNSVVPQVVEVLGRVILEREAMT